MKKKYSVGVGTLVLFWFVAVLWSVRCVVELMNGRLQGLDPIIAVLWFLTAAKWTKRYLDEKKDEEEHEI